MKKFVRSYATFLASLVGIVCGGAWIYQSGWEPEPILIFAVCSIEAVAFIILRTGPDPRKARSSLNEHQAAAANAATKAAHPKAVANNNVPPALTLGRDARIELMKPKVRILFIDDDKNFNVVKILKDSGWKNTRAVPDIKNLDVPTVKDIDIYFVDINGVGRQLNLEYEGLDLALMLKQKYPEKKIIIYSANKNSNSFHKAWDLCDFKLEKNALPYQFQNIVEQYSLEINHFI